MTNLAKRRAVPQRRSAAVKGPLILTDEQREILRDTWAWLIAKLTEGKGISADFKHSIHLFAYQLCWPRAGKYTSEKPLAYQKFAHEPALRPWRGAERDLIFAALGSMEWSDQAHTFTLKRPIADLAAQIGCSRTSLNEAIARQRVSPFPILQIDNSPSFERGGARYKGALTFSLIRDPLVFAHARDTSPNLAARQTAQAARAKALHGDVVRLQIARDRGEITPQEYRTRKALLTQRIKWNAGGDDQAPALVAVEPSAAVSTVEAQTTLPTLSAAPVLPASGGVSVLKGKARRSAFNAICEVYPKPAELESDGRVRAWQLFEMLGLSPEEAEAIKAHVELRTRTPRLRGGGWADVEPRWVPDLHTFLRDQLYTLPVGTAPPEADPGRTISTKDHPYNKLYEQDRPTCAEVKTELSPAAAAHLKQRLEHAADAGPSDPAA